MSTPRTLARMRATAETPWEDLTMADLRWLYTTAPVLLDEVERLIAEAEERQALDRLAEVGDAG